MMWRLSAAFIFVCFGALCPPAFGQSYISDTTELEYRPPDSRNASGSGASPLIPLKDFADAGEIIHAPAQYLPQNAPAGEFSYWGNYPAAQPRQYWPAPVPGQQHLYHLYVVEQGMPAAPQGYYGGAWQPAPASGGFQPMYFLPQGHQLSGAVVPGISAQGWPAYQPMYPVQAGAAAGSRSFYAPVPWQYGYQPVVILQQGPGSNGQNAGAQPIASASPAPGSQQQGTAAQPAAAAGQGGVLDTIFGATQMIPGYGSRIAASRPLLELLLKMIQ